MFYHAPQEHSDEELPKIKQNIMLFWILFLFFKGV
jgi:hypothetical protein